MSNSTNPFDTVGTVKQDGDNYRVIVTNHDKTVNKLYGSDCHNSKSAGGTIFHEKNVKSVCVVDITGFCFLYLVDGHPEKTVNVSSKEAVL